MKELISVITPNYNASQFLAETINSVINQTYKNWEMLIVDDCSTDNSVSIIRRFINKDRRIKLIRLTVNSGPAVARNKAIEVSKGNYIAFLDSDDLWLPSKLEIQIKYMRDENIALSFTSYFSVNEQKQYQKYIEAKEKISHKNLLYSNYLGCLTVIYSIRHLDKIYFPIIKKRQDWALWLKITKNNILAYGIQQPLAVYRRRNYSVSKKKINLLRYNWRIYREYENLNIFESLYYLLVLSFKRLLK